jgi:pyruvate dehydrogenase E2 component (dihydrolipoamide acetyltransferase)
MAIPITVPRLGWNMEEGAFGGWLKRDGDAVRPGDALFTLESEKATEEIESLDAGFLRIPPDGSKPGDRLGVGAVIGYLVESVDEAMPTPSVAAGSAPTVGEKRAVNEDESRAANQRGSGRISPRARRAARELGIDWTGLRGTGKNGRIREHDIRSAVGPDTGSITPPSPIRRAIVARLTESQRTTVPVTLTITADATNLVRLRNDFRIVGAEPVPSYTDLLVMLAAGALAKHPLLAAQWTDLGIRLPSAIHIGIAVDTDAGLLVPVVRNVPALDLQVLARLARELVDRARTGRLSPNEMQGGVFTVTNLGGYGIDAFTPVINPPECAVLGVGRIAKRPAVVGDMVVPREQVTLSLTFDHRIVDGAPAARFLQELVRAIEEPAAHIESGRRPS